MKIRLTIPLRNKVKELLENYLDLRDNDYALIIKVWEFYHPLGVDLEYSQFANMFASGKLISPESIRRTRQKIQEIYPHTRGVNYLNRKANIPNIIADLSQI